MVIRELLHRRGPGGPLPPADEEFDGDHPHGDEGRQGKIERAAELQPEHHVRVGTHPQSLAHQHSACGRRFGREAAVNVVHHHQRGSTEGEGGEEEHQPARSEGGKGQQHQQGQPDPADQAHHQAGDPHPMPGRQLLSELICLIFHGAPRGLKVISNQ